MNRLTLSILFIPLSLILCAQTRLPSNLIRSTEGGQIRLADLALSGKPVVVVFWATWCNPCLEEFEAIADLYEQWKDEAEFEFIAVSIDDARSTAKVKSLVSGKGWPFKVVLDENQDIKRAMNVTEVPFCFIFNKKGAAVYRHSGYTPGDELTILKEIKKAGNE